MLDATVEVERRPPRNAQVPPYCARDSADYEQLWSDRRLAYEYLPTGDDHWQAPLDAQRQLAATGRHRAVGMADLLIATIASANDVILIHNDTDRR